MANFKVAFEEGKKAALQADNARREINEVFADLNRQLSEVSNGRLFIERKQLIVNSNSFITISSNILGQDIPKYWAIVARNPFVTNIECKEIAKWHSDPHGYPCKLTWGDTEQYCENRSALEKSLTDLLRNPDIAEILLSIIRVPDKS